MHLFRIALVGYEVMALFEEVNRDGNVYEQWLYELDKTVMDRLLADICEVLGLWRFMSSEPFNE